MQDVCHVHFAMYYLYSAFKLAFLKSQTYSLSPISSVSYFPELPYPTCYFIAIDLCPVSLSSEPVLDRNFILKYIIEVGIFVPNVVV